MRDWKGVSMVRFYPANYVTFRGGESPLHFSVKALWAYAIKHFSTNRYPGITKYLSCEMETVNSDFVDLVDLQRRIAFEFQQNMSVKVLEDKKIRYLRDSHIERVIFVPLDPFYTPDIPGLPVVPHGFVRELDDYYQDIERFVRVVSL